MTDGLHITALTVHAGARVLLDLADLTVPDGALTAVIGPSGAGKTLLARGLANVTEPSLRIRRLTSRSPSDVGWMPQLPRHALDPYRTVGEQLDTTHRTHPGGLDTRAALERVGLSAHDAERFPASLSGGMAQRVVLAQLLATGAKTLVVDEPTSGLDPVLAASVRETLARVAQAGPGVLWITHDLRRLDDSVHRIWVLDAGVCVEQGATLAGLTSPTAVQLRHATPGLGARS